MTRTFPTPYLAGAKMVDGVSKHELFTSFFSTVATEPLSTAFSWSAFAPTHDPRGRFFGLTSKHTNTHRMSYFRTLYPVMSSWQTCRTQTLPKFANKPPGLVINVPMTMPSSPTPPISSSAVVSTSEDTNGLSNIASVTTTSHESARPSPEAPLVTIKQTHMASATLRDTESVAHR